MELNAELQAFMDQPGQVKHVTGVSLRDQVRGALLNRLPEAILAVCACSDTLLDHAKLLERPNLSYRSYQEVLSGILSGQWDQPYLLIVTEADGRDDNLMQLLAVLWNRYSEGQAVSESLVLLGVSKERPTYLVDLPHYHFDYQPNVHYLERQPLLDQGNTRDVEEALLRTITAAYVAWKASLDSKEHLLLLVPTQRYISQAVRTLQNYGVDALAIRSPSDLPPPQAARRLLVTDSLAESLILDRIRRVYDTGYLAVKSTSAEGYTTCYYCPIDRRSIARRSAIARRYFLSGVSPARKLVIPEAHRLAPDCLATMYMARYGPDYYHQVPEALQQLYDPNHPSGVRPIELPGLDYRPRMIASLLQAQGVPGGSDILVAALHLRPMGELVTRAMQQREDGRLFDNDVGQLAAQIRHTLGWRRKPVGAKLLALLPELLRQVYPEIEIEPGQLILDESGFFYYEATPTA